MQGAPAQFGVTGVLLVVLLVLQPAPPSSHLLLGRHQAAGVSLVAGCDLASSRRLVALCSRARKRSASPLPFRRPAFSSSASVDVLGGRPDDDDLHDVVVDDLVNLHSKDMFLDDAVRELSHTENEGFSDGFPGDSSRFNTYESPSSSSSSSSHRSPPGGGSAPSSASRLWLTLASRHRTRRSTLMQHLVHTCCTQGCSFDKLKEICFG